ncbi:hydroxylamine oxidase [Desulfovibrio sp. X2]|uniref:multiheme c-type cytochrome n=1 Tax=Desulfovibrio sp. X2 TaxID=941449 RepID=UPI000358BA66|nr:multiheme c-type cytochrome [Desulfovibrio sp. X2]EPR38706.1 hydroxylamine oxidase [Desulfovibrio sp. X2]
MRFHLLPSLALFSLLAVPCLCGAANPDASGTPEAKTSVPKPPISDATTTCLSCHEMVTPGVVAGWRASRHAQITPAEALKVPAASRRVSSSDIPEELSGTVVGCAECHVTRSAEHGKGAFEHNGFTIHVDVSPDDCAQCHAVERKQYDGNIMAHAYGNLAHNTLYMQAVNAIDGAAAMNAHGRVEIRPASPEAMAGTCFHCHGTKLRVTGTKSRDTALGPMEFPVIAGWPNNGVGRVNLDGSMGSCAACHTRHQFAVKTARQPYTCEECHNGPDVPAYKIYAASKHGGIFSTMKSKWDWNAMPWTVGRDFTAPTCAVCHISQVVTPDGTVLATRTHTMNDRLPWRIFGLPFAHPEPKSPDTSIIRNAEGLPLPTSLNGQVASSFLIDAKEMAVRKARLQKVCSGCHGSAWVEGHWARFEKAIAETDQTVLAGNRVMQKAWKLGLADEKDMFDEYPEKLWGSTWLFYANSSRFTSAMAGGGDYGVFAEGRYQLMQTVLQLQDWVDARRGKKK